ncbi:MAG: Gfo/Idh/MocA family oxidoreductase [Verrucomicrobia bacterium]|nr:Gfo/Idh/MocA family oxidoreductase [Verrucomicrobiota bacterium]
MKQTFLLTALLLATQLCPVSAADLRIGMIGLDTSHVPAFTDILNNPTNKAHVPGAKVVAAYKGGSPDIESSASRVEGYTKTLVEKYGVKIYDSIDEMVKQVDAVFIESVDGRPHLAQAIPVIKAGKPLFIDKPMAGSLKDALEIFRLAKAAKVPVWSSSSLRYGKAAQAVRAGSIGTVSYAETTSPASLEPHHPDLFWYGVHGCETLFTVMGTGCESVKRGTTADGKIEVTGKWKGGRTGIFREAKGYTGVARGDKGETPIGAYDGYAPLVVEAIKAFQTGVVPVKPEETIELLAFMEAADESKRRGGAEVTLAEVLKKAGAK